MRPAQHGRERLERDAHQIDVWLLGGQRRAGRLRVEAEHPGAGTRSLEALAHDARPKPARGAKLRHLFQEIVVRGEEKRKTRRELVHRQTARAGRLDVRDGVRERKRHFLDGGRARLADVVAADGDEIPIGRALHGKGDEVGRQAHRRPERIDVGPARDVFLQDIVLHGPGNLPQVCALLLGHGEIERGENRGCGVDGHRGGDAGERYAVEKRFHVVE